MVRCKSYGPLSDEWYNRTNKVGHFQHYFESHGLSLIGGTHSDLRVFFSKFLMEGDSKFSVPVGKSD